MPIRPTAICLALLVISTPLAMANRVDGLAEDKALVEFNVPGGKSITVVMPGPLTYATEVSEGGEATHRVKVWSEKQAVRIGTKLAFENRADLIPQAISGLRAQGEDEPKHPEAGSYSLCLRVAGHDEMLNATVPGKRRLVKRESDGAELLIFSLVQAESLYRDLTTGKLSLNVAEVSAILAGFRTSRGYVQDDGSVLGECGECAGGTVCGSGSHLRCCTGSGNSCESCTLCSSYSDFSLVFGR